jgi:PAS domain S-box-containing protein
MAETNATVGNLKVEDFASRDILNSIADGAYITDCDRNIVFWNRTAEQITGWNHGEVVGRSCRDNLLVHVDKDGHQLCGKEHCPLHRAMVTGTRSAAPVVVFAQHKDGQRVPVEVSVAPLFNGTGEVIGGIELFRDMTNAVDDLWRAKMIQAHTMESSLPFDPRMKFDVSYVPQEMVGGDFYHIERLGKDQYGMMVADFMGHGVAAALYCMQLRSLWEDWKEELTQPGRFMAQINTRLNHLAKQDGYFATGTYLLVDLAADTVTCVRAGHPAPVLLRCNGEIVRLGQQAPALGLFDKVDYPEQTEHLGPRDSLVLFTDGAVEIANRAHQELGEEGIVALLRSAQLDNGGLELPGLEEKLLRYSNELRLTDDLTLLVARRLA